MPRAGSTILLRDIDNGHSREMFILSSWIGADDIAERWLNVRFTTTHTYTADCQLLKYSTRKMHNLLEFVVTSGVIRKIFCTKSNDVVNDCLFHFNCVVFDAIRRRKIGFLTKSNKNSGNFWCNLFVNNACNERLVISSYPDACSHAYMCHVLRYWCYYCIVFVTLTYFSVFAANILRWIKMIN